MTDKNTKPQTEKKKVSFSRIWNDKRLRSIVLSAGVVLLCAVVYVVLLFTVLQSEEEQAPPTVGNHGEQMSGDRPFVVDPMELEQIQSIRVENELGGFNYYRGTDDTFYFEGAEHMLYDATSDFTGGTEGTSDVLSGMSMIDSLFGLVRYMLATEEVHGYNKANLSTYGLDGEGQASLTVSYLDDDGNTVEKKVFFGNKTVSGTGFYCMLEGRDALYIMRDDYISRCVFTDMRAYFIPQVALALPTADSSNVTKFSIKKHGEDFLSIYKLSDEEFQENGQLFTHAFSNPKGYFPSPDNFSNLLQSFASFIGESVLEYDITRKLSDPQERDGMLETFRLYSLMDQNNKWVYELYYEYEEYDFDVTLYLSEKLEVESEEGAEKEYIYYIYSPDFDLIAEFSAESLAWVEWDLLSYMDNHAFSVSIDRVSSLNLTYDNTNVSFTLTGEGEELKVTSSGNTVDTYNFRQLYKAIVFTTIDGYANEPQGAEPILRLEVKLRDGSSYNYSFYSLTARKAYYTLNGSGQFYINRDYIKQIMTACTDLLAGKDVVVDHKN